jgi:peptidoglycan/xylan/chitin deacetylase (PgdA/CDA1 family)
MLMKQFLRFPGFLNKACTLSYDDGVKEDAQLIEIMRKYGLKGTFNLNSKNIENPDGTNHRNVDYLKNLYGDDMEIALHGYQHLSLAQVTPAAATRDVMADREFIEKTFNRIVRGMAYANGSYNDDVVKILRDAGVVYSRTTKSTEAFDLPDEWLTLHPTCHHNNPRLFELVEEFFAPPKMNYFWAKKPRLFYLWGHSYEFPKNDNWDVIEKFGEIMASHGDVWHATNMEIYKYIEAFGRLVFSHDLKMIENPTSTDLYVNVLGTDILVKSGETVTV